MRRTLATVAAAALLALAACSSSDGDRGGGDSAGASADLAPAEASAAAPEAAPAYAEGATDEAEADTAAATDPVERSVISTGEVSLRSPDVAQTVFDVRRIVGRVAGRVEEDRTDTDKDGEVVRSFLVLRVPSARFDDALQALKGTATLVSSAADSQDVTTEVLDVDVRVQVQRRSIARIALLLDRAESIGDIVSIEAQLSRRQADLASLERKQAALASQTAMSTVSVSVERTQKKPAPAEEESDEAGFLSGLDAGWGALRTFGVGLATVVGALLPWLLVLLVLAVPGVPLLRRLRRRPGTVSRA